jgi:hypothetical protein
VEIIDYEGVKEGVSNMIGLCLLYHEPIIPLLWKNIQIRHMIKID